MTIRAQPRTATAALGNVALIPRSKRSSLSDKDRNRLITDIETGLSQKFTAVDLNRLQSEDAFQLGHTASLAQQINSVFDHLIKYDLVHVLTACPFLDFNTSDPTLQANGMKTINLLQAYDTFSVELATKTVEWMRQYLDDEELLDELTWTHTFLLNCCENESGEGSLYNTVSAEIDRLRKHNTSFVGGPVTFMIILSNIISSSNEALKILEAKLKTLKLTDFRGENVNSLTTQLTYVINRLQQTSLPEDLTENLLRILQTSSNKSFNSTFSSLANVIRLRLIHPTPTWETIFSRAKEIYLEELNADRWNVSAEGSTESIFNANKSKSSGQQTFVCRICGGDHLGPNCPHCQNANDGPDAAPPKKSNPITRRPDKAFGDSVTTIQVEDKKVKCWTRKDRNGNTLKWCGACKFDDKQGRWTNGHRAHFTHEHKFSRRPTANLASGDPNDSPSDAPSTDASAPSDAASSDRGGGVSFSTSLRTFAEAARGSTEN